MGYSASQLLQTNNLLESEIHRLKNALLAEQGQQQIEIQRSNMLQQELRNAQIQRDNANKRVNEVMAERRIIIDMKTEMGNRIHGLEVANRSLRDEVAAANLATAGKNEEIRAITYQSEIVRQQIQALNERNAALKTKCEETVAQNRRQYEEMEAKQRFVDAAQLNVRKAEADLQLANIEIQRLLRELEESQQGETSSLADKRSIEAILSRKEDEIRVANYKATAELKIANDKIEKLENKLKMEKPVIHNDLTVFQETIYIAIETIKSTYEKQLARMEAEIEELRQEKEQKVMEEQNEQQEQMEELPDWLQTPMKPDPAKMGELKFFQKTVQCKINLDSASSQDSTHSSANSAPFPQSSASSSSQASDQNMDQPPCSSSGSSVDTTGNWNQTKSPLELLPPVHVPLLGTTGTSTASQVSTSSDIATSSDSIQEMTSTEKVINVSTYTEEDLLLLEPNEMISPGANLNLMEQQLLDTE